MINKEGLDIIKKYEGCYLNVYLDPVGIKTSGYGHTGKDLDNLRVGMMISREKAESDLLNDIKKAESCVAKYDPIYHWNENEYSALVSFAFNIGNIDQLTDRGRRDKDTIKRKMLEYCKAGGKVLKGLQSRRLAEQELFCKPITIKTVVPNYQKGVQYELTANLAVHVSPSLSSNLVPYAKLTKNAKEHDKDKNGYLDKDTKVTCLSKECDNDGNMWIRIPSGWVCAYLISKDKLYVR